MRTDRTMHIFLWFAAALLLLSAGFWLVSTRLEAAATPQPAAAAAAFPPEISLPPNAIAAKAAVVYDPVSRRLLYAKNAHEPLPLASLTKLMTAETVLANRREDLAVAITPEALLPEGESGLRVGEEWSLRDLLLYGLVASSNDAMAAALGSLGSEGVDAMNGAASRLGLTQTYFLNPTGLDEDLDAQLSGAYGSARDVAVLATAFMSRFPEYFEATAKPSISFPREGYSVEARATALPLISTPGFIGAKTGYTDLAGGNLVAAFDVSVGYPLIAVVLGSTREGRFTDMQALIAAAREAAAAAQ